jgi:hypothetical protein
MTVNIIDTNLSSEYLRMRITELFLEFFSPIFLPGSDGTIVSEDISISLFTKSMEGQGYYPLPLILHERAGTYGITT